MSPMILAMQFAAGGAQPGPLVFDDQTEGHYYYRVKFGSHARRSFEWFGGDVRQARRKIARMLGVFGIPESDAFGAQLLTLERTWCEVPFVVPTGRTVIESFYMEPEFVAEFIRAYRA